MHSSENIKNCILLHKVLYNEAAPGQIWPISTEMDFRPTSVGQIKENGSSYLYIFNRYVVQNSV